MKNALIILFIALWFSNYWICSFAFPNIDTDLEQWGKFVVLREVIFEIMFFTLLISSIFKPSREARALIVGTSIIVSLSIIDKITGILDYAYSDIIVIAFAIFGGLFIYKTDG